MLFNSYSYEISYEQFRWIYLQQDVRLLLVTVNNRVKFEIEIVHDLSCHPILYTSGLVPLGSRVRACSALIYLTVYASPSSQKPRPIIVNVYTVCVASVVFVVKYGPGAVRVRGGSCQQEGDSWPGRQELTSPVPYYQRRFVSTCESFSDIELETCRPTCYCWPQLNARERTLQVGMLEP